MFNLNMAVMAEIDQMCAEIRDGNASTLRDARDWLADIVLDGESEAICRLLIGWLLAEEAAKEGVNRG